MTRETLCLHNIARERAQLGGHYGQAVVHEVELSNVLGKCDVVLWVDPWVHEGGKQGRLQTIANRKVGSTKISVYSYIGHVFIEDTIRETPS